MKINKIENNQPIINKNDKSLVNNVSSQNSVNKVYKTNESEYVETNFDEQNISAEQQAKINTAVTEAIISVLESILSQQEQAFKSTKENNGILAKGWDWVKNKTGLGAGSDKTQAKIDELKSQINDLKNGKGDLGSVYKNITGNDLTNDEITKLAKGEADFSKSELGKSVSKYQQGQKQFVNVFSGVASALAIGGLVASGIFTGGLSWVAAGAICVGAGTVAYMVPQAVDGLTEKDGYSGMEFAEDLATGIVDSTVQTVTMGAAKGITGGLTSKFGEKIGKVIAGETVAVMLGDGMAIGNYLTQAGVTRLDDLSLTDEDLDAYEKIISGSVTEDDPNYQEIFAKAEKYYNAISNNSDISLEGLGKTAAVSTVASLAAGAGALTVNNLIGMPLANLTANSSSAIQNAARITTGTLTGTAAGTSASVVGGGANYIISAKCNGEDINFEDWLESSTENILPGMFVGGLTGIAFEAVHIAAGTQAPAGTKSTKIYKSENGIAKEYLDAKGNVIARDISAKDISSYLKSQEKLVEYNPNKQNQPLINQGTKTIRFNYKNLKFQQINQWGNLIKPQNINEFNNATETEINGLNNNKDTLGFVNQNKELSNANNNVLTGNVQNNNIFAYMMLNKMFMPQMAFSGANGKSAEFTPFNSNNILGNYGINNRDTGIQKSDIQIKFEKLVTASENERNQIEGLEAKSFKEKRGPLTGTQVAQMLNATRTFGPQVSNYLQGKFDEAYKDFLSIFKDTGAEDVKAKIEAHKNVHDNIKTDFMYGRTKGLDSITDKMLSKIAKGKNVDSFKIAKECIGDGIGTRYILKDPESTQDVVNSIVSAIKNKKIKVTEIHNYHGEGIDPYFDDKQIKQIKYAAKKTYGIDILVASGMKTDEIRKNAYSAVQINVEYNNGALGEIQVRGKIMDQVAEIEHIIYDMKQGKKVKDKYKEIEKIYKKLSEAQKEKYDKYWKEMYEYAIKTERGATLDVPEIKNYGLPEKLSFESLKIYHNS